MLGPGFLSAAGDFENETKDLPSNLFDGRGAGGEILTRTLWDVSRAQARPRLEDLAQRIEPVAHWDDLVLPHHEKSMLREIEVHVRRRHTVYEEWGFARMGGRESASCFDKHQEDRPPRPRFRGQPPAQSDTAYILHRDEHPTVGRRGMGAASPRGDRGRRRSCEDDDPSSARDQAGGLSRRLSRFGAGVTAGSFVGIGGAAVISRCALPRVEGIKDNKYGDKEVPHVKPDQTSPPADADPS